MSEKIKSLLIGKADKKTHSYVIFIMLIILIVCWSIAQLLYEDNLGKYNILRNYISNQGNPDYTSGWLLFTLSVCVISILLFSHFIYIYRRFELNLPKFMKLILSLSIFLGFNGNIGFFLVGLFNENIPLIHDPAATYAFISYGLGVIILIPILMWKIYKKHPWPKPKEVIILYGIIIILVVILTLVSSFSITLTQWLGFFAVLVWIYGIFLIIPSEEKKNKVFIEYNTKNNKTTL
ncbi:MAG: DUF998 domain-containing protein [archaeon]|nr:DUF998 domain-containing protein [archaeon]